LAEHASPVDAALRNAVARAAGRYRRAWPTSAAIYLPNGRLPAEGDLLRNLDWARTLKGAIDASLHEEQFGRQASIQAAIDYFYAGPVAQKAVEFSLQTTSSDDSGQAHSGLLALEDFAAFGRNGTLVDDPVHVTY